MTICWRPTHPERTRMAAFMQACHDTYGLTFTDYESLYQWSIQQPAEFWQQLAQFFTVDFVSPPEQIIQHAQDFLNVRWFEGATFNFTANMLKRRDNHIALISVDESGYRTSLSYADLYDQVAACAAGLIAHGVTAGDRVVGVLPNTPYAAIAMLATAMIGAIWSCCSPDFGVDAIVDRFSQIEPRVLFITDEHHYLGKSFAFSEKIAALKIALPTVTHIVLCPRHEAVVSHPQTIAWREWLIPASTLTPLNVPFDHPLYIMFSSGTTGKPKCIVHRAGGVFLQLLKELGLHTDIQPHDRLCFYTTTGWMMWQWMVSALALGATVVLYEGAPHYPDPMRLFRLIDEEGITVFGTSAKFLSSIEKHHHEPRQAASLTTLRTILSTGSPLLPHQFDYVYTHVKSDVQLSSISGGTDIVSCFALGNPLLPVYRGEIQCRGLGMAVCVFDEQGQPVVGVPGELVCTKTFPTVPLGFWGDHDNTAFKKAYFSRYNSVWTHGDVAILTDHNSLIIEGRSDTTLNPGGVRIGTAEIYRQIEYIPEILESVAVGQAFGDDTRIILFVRLHEGVSLDNALMTRVRERLAEHASPRHVPAKILEVPDVPRTFNGKIAEMAVKQTIDNQPVPNVSALQNPESLVHFAHRKELGG